MGWRLSRVPKLFLQLARLQSSPSNWGDRSRFDVRPFRWSRHGRGSHISCFFVFATTFFFLYLFDYVCFCSGVTTVKDLNAQAAQLSTQLAKECKEVVLAQDEVAEAYQGVAAIREAIGL